MAEVISDVREPIVAVSAPVDENENRRKQVKVRNPRNLEPPPPSI